MAKRIVTGICERNHLAREGLSALLPEQKYRTHLSVQECHELEAFPAFPAAQVLFIVCLESADGTARTSIARLRALHPSAKILVLVDQPFVDEARWRLEAAGADGILLKASASQDKFLRSVELVMMGEHVYSPGSQKPAAVPEDEASDIPAAEPASPVEEAAPTESKREDGLSRREWDILEHLIKGSPNKIIARQCDITEATVKVHLKAILRKIRVNNRTQAAVWALQRGNFRDGPKGDDASGRTTSLSNERSGRVPMSLR